MATNEVKVTFKTITPLWTGDAWQDNREIRPSSLMGSLRFWFEVICYFNRICDSKRDHFNHQLGRFEKEVDRKKFKECLLKEGNSFEAKIKCLLEQDISLPLIVFGTTNWKSLIEIKDIEVLNIFQNYKFPIGEISFPELEHSNKIPKWYFKEGFYGEFEVIFKVEEEILKSIFYPLLTFMDKYGFWGGKWNIGYGRLKFSNSGNFNRNWRKEKFIFFKLRNSELIAEEVKFSNFIEFMDDLDLLLNIVQNSKKVKVLLQEEVTSNDLKKTIKKLMEIKAKARANFIESYGLRHKIFGTTSPPPYDKNLLPQGSKILPYISKEDDNFRGGFVSIVNLLTLEGKNNG